MLCHDAAFKLPLTCQVVLILNVPATIFACELLRSRTA